MRLQYGITSFYDPDCGEPPKVDFKKFKQFCYEISRVIGSDVKEIQHDGPAHNYYYAIFNNSEKNGIVCNAHYPLVAFVKSFDGPSFGKVIESAENPNMASLVEKSQYFIYLPSSKLNESVSLEDCQDLAPCEIQQIQYWGSRTVGEVIFNYYD